MTTIRTEWLLLSAAGLLAATPVFGAGPTEEMRMFARMFATLEARDIKGYCGTMHGAPYAGYLDRVCRSAVQNKQKKPEDCSQPNIAQQVRLDAEKCLAMPATDIDKAVTRGAEAMQKFLKETAAQGIDGEKLLLEERAKLR